MLRPSNLSPVSAFGKNLDFMVWELLNIFFDLDIYLGIAGCNRAEGENPTRAPEGQSGKYSVHRIGYDISFLRFADVPPPSDIVAGTPGEMHVSIILGSFYFHQYYFIPLKLTHNEEIKY